MKTTRGAFFVWQIVIAGAVAAGLALSFTGWRWDLVKSDIHRAYPALRQLSTQELAAWLADPGPITPTVLDVRTRAEFDVSHLPGARWVAPEAQADEVSTWVSRDAPVVVYCSVGNRSADFAERLRGAGFKYVNHLDGAIFKWANEDRPLVSDRGPTSAVHPQNRTWEHLLKRERRATDVAAVR